MFMIQGPVMHSDRDISGFYAVAVCVTPAYARLSKNALASLRSSVSKPSVNQLYMGASRSRASVRGGSLAGRSVRGRLGLLASGGREGRYRRHGQHVPWRAGQDEAVSGCSGGPEPRWSVCYCQLAPATARGNDG